jgi:hypothetical protein
MVVAMANFYYFTVDGKNNSDADRRSLSVVSVSGEHVKCVTVLSLLQAQCFQHNNQNTLHFSLLYLTEYF